MKKICKKNMKGWNSKPEILHEDKTHESAKNVSKCFFLKILLFQPFMVKIQSKKIFLLFFPSFTKEIQAKMNELKSETGGRMKNAPRHFSRIHVFCLHVKFQAYYSSPSCFFK